MKSRLNYLDRNPEKIPIVAGQKRDPTQILKNPGNFWDMHRIPKTSRHFFPLFTGIPGGISVLSRRDPDYFFSGVSFIYFCYEQKQSNRPFKWCQRSKYLTERAITLCLFKLRTGHLLYGTILIALIDEECILILKTTFVTLSKQQRIKCLSCQVNARQ